MSSMKNNKNKLAALLIPLLIIVILSRFGIININFSSLLYFGMMLGGFTLVWVVFGRLKRVFLFCGTITFLLGFLLLIKENYIFINNSDILWPLLCFIIGIGMLILYIEDTKTSSFAYASVLIISFGIGFIIKADTFSIGKFFSALGGIISENWLILLATFIFSAIVLSLYKK